MNFRYLEADAHPTHQQLILGVGGVTALRNGNNVVPSPNWGFAGIADAGAITWGDGTTGISGAVQTKTTVLLTPKEIDKAVEKAGKKSGDYRPPGA